MTTAATTWVNAAIGAAAGTGEFAIAAAATALTLIVLALLPPIEDYFERRVGALSMVYEDQPKDQTDLPAVKILKHAGHRFTGHPRKKTNIMHDKFMSSKSTLPPRRRGRKARMATCRRRCMFTTSSS